ncbi:hypothetical protein [Streptomyces buecherae]|uniref:Uncharacterized protein n=1 Tax=Streptomyces buecherae TaxID=2763006 RepID=A0A7H8N697_9ACTN|nr:hypothetical protein [Streptomyces buecherae]QKW49931.1 hypothetical protein HUT08_10675 [Streptomyces buecherae]
MSAAGAFVEADLEAKRLDHAPPHRVGEARDLAPVKGQSVGEGRVLPGRCLLPMIREPGFRVSDPIIDLSHPRLYSLHESAVGIVGEFECGELAIASLPEVPQGLVERPFPLFVVVLLGRLSLGKGCGQHRPSLGAKTRVAKNWCSGSKRCVSLIHRLLG